MGQLCGAVRVLTHHQLQSRNSVVHAASRIDAGRNGVADIFCGDRFARKAHLFQQRFQTRTVRVLQLAQARLDKGAVFAGKRHHVRHSTHSGKVAAVVQHFFRRAAIQCGTQLERHARTAQALEGTGVVLTTGVYHGNGLGQSFRRQMMVGNDQVNAQFSGIIGFFHSRNAVIHRHDQLAALIVALVQPTLVIPFQKDHILAVVIYNITQELEYLNIFDATIEIITNEDIKFVVLHLTKVFT